MTRRVKHSKRAKHTKRSKRSKSMKRSRGGTQGAPLDQAFSGVVLPSDVYRPILKPMIGGDGVVYQAPANLAAPVYAPMKGRRGRRRSVKRKGKARAPGHAPGHALPQGFGQMVQSFRPL